MAAAAPARKAPPEPTRTRKRHLAAAPARTAPARRAPARKAPTRKPPPRKAPVRRPGGQLIPIAVGTATAVRNLPDSSLIVRLTRGRAWIAVLGVLLVGIVGLNVVTLSLAATAGQIDQNIMALDEENSFLRGLDAQRSGAARIRNDAAGLGLSAAALDQVGSVRVSPDDVKTVAQRLAAAGTAY